MLSVLLEKGQARPGNERGRQPARERRLPGPMKAVEANQQGGEPILVQRPAQQVERTFQAFMRRRGFRAQPCMEAGRLPGLREGRPGGDVRRGRNNLQLRQESSTLLLSWQKP